MLPALSVLYLEMSLTKGQFHILDLKSFGSALWWLHALHIQSSHTKRGIRNRAWFVFPHLEIAHSSTAEIQGLILLKSRNALYFTVQMTETCNAWSLCDPVGVWRWELMLSAAGSTALKSFLGQRE